MPSSEIDLQHPDGTCDERHRQAILPAVVLAAVEKIRQGGRKSEVDSGALRLGGRIDQKQDPRPSGSVLVDRGEQVTGPDGDGCE